jgi:Mg2+ and Co2+ transporter CorA
MKTLRVRQLAAEIDNGLDAIINAASDAHVQMIRDLQRKVRTLQKELHSIHRRSPKEIAEEVQSIVDGLHKFSSKEAAWQFAINTFNRKWFETEPSTSFSAQLCSELLNYFKRPNDFWSKIAKREL